jgi:type I restriction enzyme S subunit
VPGIPAFADWGEEVKQGWRATQLGDLVDFVGGGTPSRDNPAYWGGEIPWASVKDLGDHDLQETTENITHEGLRKSASNLIEAGTVIIASRVGLGKVCINRKPVAINQDLKALIPKNKEILPKFLLYFIISEADAIGRSGVGATVMGVTIPQLQRIKLALPPLPEQHRIVNLLDEAEELRRRREQADRRTADLIPALFYEMFGDPTSNPKGWRTAPVSSFAANLEGGRNVAPAGSDDGASRYRVLKISAVTWGDFRPQECKPVPAAYVPPPEHVVQPGDLLFSRANTAELVGATAFVHSTPPNLILPDKLWRFVWTRPSLVEPFYVWWLLQTHSIRRELSARATGTGGSMKNISRPKLFSLVVPIPPLPLQHEFAARVAEIRALQDLQAESRRRLDDLFQSMLHRAFQGEL